MEPAPSTVIVERAPPKVNLTLRVLGRRPDGYHELESLVAFAHDVADVVTLTVLAPVDGQPGDDPAPPVTCVGPFGGSIAGENLLAVALRHIGEAAATTGSEHAHRLVRRLGGVSLDKRLPIAAGIGGGSSDAAALLRAVQRADPEAAAAIDWVRLAARLGADVPVCLAATAQVMRGIGERLEPRPGVPPLAAVLVNPRVAVPADKTAQVFRALAAAPLPADVAQDQVTPPAFADRAALLAHMRAIGNDLTSPARTVVPAVADVLAALTACEECEIVQVSGGGPTVFGVFPDAAKATAAADRLRAAQPDWWVATSSLT